MRFKKILLISPPSSSYLGAARAPQNLGYLAQALQDKNIACHILDMRIGYKWNTLRNHIDAFKPDLIGVTLVSLEYLKSYAFIKRIREYAPFAKIVTGGPHITVLKETVMDQCGEIDFAVINEGEETLTELCMDAFDIDQIKGLMYREGSQIHRNEPRPVTVDLDTISWPRFEGFEMHKYLREMPFNSSRGCPYECVFCPNKMLTRKFRYRSPENVVDEIAYWYHKGYRIFNYDDDNFTLRNDRVYAICDEIEKRGIVNAEFRCSNGIRADRVDYPLLKRMREVGFNYIAFGVDGGNNRMLKINKKGETIEQIESGIKYACELGYDVKIFVITAMPYETLADVEDAIHLVKKYPVKRVILNNPIPYPGTELYDTVKKNDWFIVQPEVYLNNVTENVDVPLFVTPELSYEDRVNILKRIRKVEKEVTKNAVKRMYIKWGVFSEIAASLFATRFVEKMFFKFMPFRRFIESIRYSTALKKRAAAGENL